MRTPSTVIWPIGKLPFKTRSNECLVCPQFQLLHLEVTGSAHDFYAVSLLIQHTALPERSVWRKPRNEPLGDHDRAVVIAIRHQPTVRTAIRALPQWHVLLMT